jgi:hypothetical protein
MDEKKEYNDIGTNRDDQLKKNEPSYGLTPLGDLRLALRRWGVDSGINP